MSPHIGVAVRGPGIGHANSGIERRWCPRICLFGNKKRALWSARNMLHKMELLGVLASTTQMVAESVVGAHGAMPLPARSAAHVVIMESMWAIL